MKILVTGNLGYIGTILSERLISQGHEVIGLDTGFFENTYIGPKPTEITTIYRDLRDLLLRDVKGFEVVIHLAGLSNDPLGALSPSLTEDINYLSTVKLASYSRDAGVKRFIYASTQSIYGISNINTELDEDNSLKAPVTEYAKTKWKAEKVLLKMASSDFLTTSFRPSTVYGVSPRQRCDIVFNNLVGSGYTSKIISVKSDGTPWRPVIHISDVCQAFEAGIYAPWNVLNGRAFNVGTVGGNYTVKDLAHSAQKANPGTSLQFTGEHGSDSRTYRVNFDRIHSELSDYFKPRWNLELGAKELVDHWTRIGFTREMFESHKCNRLKHLKKLEADRILNKDLKFV